VCIVNKLGSDISKYFRNMDETYLIITDIEAFRNISKYVINISDSSINTVFLFNVSIGINSLDSTFPIVPIGVNSLDSTFPAIPIEINTFPVVPKHVVFVGSNDILKKCQQIISFFALLKIQPSYQHIKITVDHSILSNL